MAQASEQPIYVSEMKVEYQDWQPRINSSCSLRAVLGIDITTEAAGLVRSVYFKPGAAVNANELLVELNIDSEKAQLASLEANYDLAKITYERDKAQYEANAVSKAILDADFANLKSYEAQVAEQKAVIAKKLISAPFAGRLGISLVYPGQYVNPGDGVVTLQSLDPIFVDFFVPQQSMNRVELGKDLALTTDAYPGKVFTGKITTINPKVDPKTRNIEIEATLENPEHLLLPGMFGNVTVNVGKQEKFLTLPQNAITYNPYGDIVYLVQEGKKKIKGKNVLTVQQTFVVVGEKRGDQVAILSGIKAGDRIVTGGQMKLKNGTIVEINNKVTPSFDANPKLENEH